MRSKQIEKQIATLERQLADARKALALAKKKERQEERQTKIKRLEKLGLLELSEQELKWLLAGDGSAS